MEDYCSVPPYVRTTANPNLLLMIDNSSSQYDLEYVDLGRTAGVCAGTTTGCSSDADCTSPATCVTSYYCYDETYSSANTYSGYFDVTNSDGSTAYYQYDFTDDYFNKVSSMPSCSGAGAKSITNTLCVNIGSNIFAASGKYLNWLTASKFDIAKQILTGGKWASKVCTTVQSTSPDDVVCTTDADCVSGETCVADSRSITFLQAESRGCVGHSFFKEPLTSDFVNFAMTASDPNKPSGCTAGVDTPCSLGITFGIRGPKNNSNLTALSSGGQTYIDIYTGTYNNQVCQTAINYIISGTANQNTIADAIAACIGYSASNTKKCQYKIESSGAEVTCNTSNDFEGNTNSDCQSTTSSPATSGTCEAGADFGSCTLNSPADGFCASTGGSCTANNGTDCSKVCVGGTDAGATCNADHDCDSGVCSSDRQCLGADAAHANLEGHVCNNVNDCLYSYCSGDETINCTSDSSICASTKKCSGGFTNGRSCSTDSDCDNGECSGDPSVLCHSSSDCSGNKCSVGSPRNEGLACTTDFDCSLGLCLQPSTTQIRSTFAQSMLSCDKYRKYLNGESGGADIGSNELTQVYGGQSGNAGAPEVYRTTFICNGGTEDGETCTTLGAVCGTGGTCVTGPDNIRQGSPVLLFSTAYTGYCAISSDNWDTTTWVGGRGGEYTASGSDTAADVCIKAKYRAYCTALDVPPVVDPTEAPSQTESYSNLPAILGDLGVSGQLTPLKTDIKVQINQSTEPKGLLQQFSGLIRFGAMEFNYNGSPTECDTVCSNNSSQACSSDSDCASGGTCTAPVPCPKKCSTNTNVACYTCEDCPLGCTETCGPTTKNTDNTDGGKILSALGSAGICSVTTSTSCTSDLDCSSNETCIYVGNHSTSGTLVNSIDMMKAATWTPFSEAMFDAIAYFTQNTSDSTKPKRINTGDFKLPSEDSDWSNPIQKACQDNNVLLITDGQSTTDRQSGVMTFVGSNTAPSPSTSTTTTACTSYSTSPQYCGSTNVDDIAYYGQNHALTNSGVVDADTNPTGAIKPINTHVVYSGTPCQFKDDYEDCCASSSVTQDSNGKDKCDAYAAETDPEREMKLTAGQGGGTYSFAQDPDDLYTAIYSVMNAVIGRASAGTAASVLASGEGSGNNLIQAVYYPKRTFKDSSNNNAELGWTGRITNLWYYTSPFFTGSTITDDYSGGGAQDNILDLSDDRAVSTYFVPSSGVTFTKPNGASATSPVTYTKLDGTSASCADCTLADLNNGASTVRLEDLSTLWEAGKVLWSGTAASARTMFTPFITGGTSAGAGSNLMLFDYAANSVTALQPYLQASSTDSGVEATNIIKFTRGEDVSGYRSRDYYEGGTTAVWKLGDVIDSTPKIASWIPLNNYDTVYGDQTYAYYTNSSVYTSRGMVFAGANDGMLHAFHLGLLQTINDPAHPNQKASLSANGITMGKEIWAFIPKNALPYLKYMADRAYCHVYAVDLTSQIVDVNVGTASDAANLYDTAVGTSPVDCSTSLAACKWRTYLIGGMKFGGASRARVCSSTTTTKCAADSDCPAGETCTTPTNCVGTPILDPADATKGFGFSSYFALDITDTLAHPDRPDLYPPVLKWEFSDADLDPSSGDHLGFTTSEPVIVRVGDRAKYGRWVVVFGSGPTGPIDKGSLQFLGLSEQPLKFFAFDIKGGPAAGVTTIAADSGITAIDNAFAGPMQGQAVDPDLDYEDEVIYVPYTKKSDTDGTWTDGGVARIRTYDSTTLSNWKWSKLVDGIGPVTTSLGKLLKKNGCYVATTTDTSGSALGCLWLFGGTGRYFYKRLNDMDDPSGQRELFGVKEPCYDAIKNGNNCTDEVDVTASSFKDSTCSSAATAAAVNACAPSETAANGASVTGWHIDLDSCKTKAGATVNCSASNVYFRAERVVTGTVASGQGVVFFTSFKPYNDACSLGGQSSLWAVRYNTGGAPGAAFLQGQALLQLSTGSIVQVNLSQAFTAAGGRKTSSATLNMEGIGGGSPTVMGAPAATKRVIHIRER